MNKQETIEAVATGLKQAYATAQNTRSSALVHTPVQVGGAAVTLTGWALVNQIASPVYVKFYDSTASPTVGTDVPLLTLEVLANGYYILPPQVIGIIKATTNLWMACTTESADSGTTSPATGCVATAFYRGW